MSYKLCSAEKAQELCPQYFEVPLYKEAIEDGRCEFVLDDMGTPSVAVLYKMDGLGDNIGLYIQFFSSDISVWSAREDKYGIRGTYSIISDLDKDISLSELVNKCLAVINKCPVCGKEIPFSEQKGFGFAGRCCPDCLPAMKAKHEYPGWTK